MKIILLTLILSGCAILSPQPEIPRRERDREAMIDCAKRLYDAGMTEEGVRRICNDALGKIQQ